MSATPDQDIITQKEDKKTNSFLDFDNADDTQRREPSVQRIAKGLLQNVRIATMKDTNEIYGYDVEGIYQPVQWYIESVVRRKIDQTVTRHKMNEILYYIQTSTYTERSDFDSDPDWLHVANGWVNLKTGKFEEHSPDRLSLSKLPVNYNPKAKCFVIKDFLKGTLDDENIAKIVRMLGYCLLANCKYQKAFMLVGTGSNGKSTLINVIEALIGKQNASNVSLQALSERFAKAQLYGKSINTFADIPNDKISETGIFKMLVTGDPMFAEKKGKDGFSFNNRAKLIFSANEIPKSNDESNAYYRRWTIIPFRRSFEGDNDDKNLIQKLTTPEELSGLLNVAIAGLKALENEGGFGNESIDKIRATYETNASRVKDFIEEMCVLATENPEHYIEGSRLQEAYRQYANAKGDKTLDENMLGKELKRLRVEHKQKRIHGKHRWCYVGVKLKSEIL